MAGNTKYVQRILGNTIDNVKNVESGSIVIGVGIKAEYHLGLKLKLLSDLGNGPYIDCEFQILNSGNAFHDLERYVKSKQVINLKSLGQFKDKYFRKEFFTLANNLPQSPISFKIGDKALITARNNKGIIVEIFKIDKYPDDPDTDKGRFGAYYQYEFNGKLLKKKVENLELVK